MCSDNYTKAGRVQINSFALVSKGSGGVFTLLLLLADGKRDQRRVSSIGVGATLCMSVSFNWFCIRGGNDTNWMIPELIVSPVSYSESMLSVVLHGYFEENWTNQYTGQMYNDCTSSVLASSAGPSQ